MKFTLTPVLAVLLAGLLSAGPALAVERAAAQACRADFKKLCSGVKPGDGRGAQCLKQHESEVSDGCKTAMASAARCVEKVRQVCGADGDAAARKACVKEHAAELGDCKGAG
jgi:hypothetical protein